ncbi:fumarylacetoacetate hydrolase family protein [Glycomyces endophyticus]|uniref:Fumarylacetoacetate hydrolase family protein n=1 Tax=Glycomyces endophyticus TaxID=480996 RepID=A0ABN2HIG7_9ACTN
MRYCRVEVEYRRWWGRVEGEEVLLLTGSPLTGAPEPTGGTVPVAAARFLPPVAPGVFYAVGLNYRGHIEHARAMGHPGAAVPERPEVGYRANNALTGHRDAIVRPADLQGRFEAEGELVAVVGKPLRRAGADEAREAVFGWTIGNDVSAREWQHGDRTLWRAKNSDTFKPMGPWIETEVDPLAQTTEVRVNGELKAAFDTGAMVFDPYEYLAEMSRYLTVHPGDVLWMGADGTCEITAGDTVEVAISGIGALENPVVEDEPIERSRR